MSNTASRRGRADPRYEGVFRGIGTIRRMEQVREQLLSAIERGDFKPGDVLPSERVLAELFDVSRVSVREAIRSLEAIGVLEVQHGRGTFVVDRQEGRRTPSRWLDLYRTQVLELLEVRGTIDQLVAEKAAERADEGAVEAVKAAHQRYLEAASDPSTPVDRLVELDIAFHNAIGEASGNQLAADLLQDLNTYLHESRKLVLAPSGRPAASGREHGRIVSAIAARDPEAARAAAARHVEAVRRLLEELGDAGGTDPVPGRR
ncbi:MAG TPA: FCD domain-containing protein [Actinomycetota bacterium]|nr:FCD domain-containing protein [Actinomycetota bacterium]